MLDHYGATEENWQTVVPKVPMFEGSETPCFVGRAIVRLAGASQAFFKEKYGADFVSKTLDDTFYEYLTTNPVLDVMYPDWP